MKSIAKLTSEINGRIVIEYTDGSPPMAVTPKSEFISDTQVSVNERMALYNALNLLVELSDRVTHLEARLSEFVTYIRKAAESIPVKNVENSVVQAPVETPVIEAKTEDTPAPVQVIRKSVIQRV